MDSTNIYRHHQAAHCESGVTSNLLLNEGMPISEAMAFGLGSGIFFVHLPFVKVMGLPLTSYRSLPGTIFKKTCKRLGVPYAYQNFSNPLKGTRALDEHLARHQVVGLRTNIYWLPYIPERFRFQFNGHNIVVVAKDQSHNSYQVSDPVLEAVSDCPARALNKARFARGIMAPKGLMFFPKPLAGNASDIDSIFPAAIHAAIAETTRRMLHSPFPFFGIAGIRYLGRRMQRWPIKLSTPETLKQYVANVVRMQEEIGTGGAGFRFLYAAFLQEASERLNNKALSEAADHMTQAGNVWREFATLAARFCKDRLDGSYSQLPELLHQIAAQERAIYVELRRRYL